jgi:hypothetical protein
MPNPIPLSLQVTRFLLWCLLISSMVTFLIGLTIFMSQRLPENASVKQLALLTLGIRGLVGAIAAVALRGIQQQKSYGRWLSMAILVLVVVGSIDKIGESGALQIIGQALVKGQLPPVEGKLTDDFNFDNSFPIYKGYPDLARHALGDMLSDSLTVVLPGFLATRLVFSVAVRRFFQQG